jgi:hypothetical protein
MRKTNFGEDGRRRSLRMIYLSIHVDVVIRVFA